MRRDAAACGRCLLFFISGQRLPAVGGNSPFCSILTTWPRPNHHRRKIQSGGGALPSLSSSATAPWCPRDRTHAGDAAEWAKCRGGNDVKRTLCCVRPARPGDVPKEIETAAREKKSPPDERDKRLYSGRQFPLRSGVLYSLSVCLGGVLFSLIWYCILQFLSCQFLLAIGEGLELFDLEILYGRKSK